MKSICHYFTCLLVGYLSFFMSCNRSVDYPSEPALASINIIDRNGLSETISNSDRLKQYENVDFLTDQPYQKVLRVFGRDDCGNIKSFITSYHPNGQPRQYLEVVNNRAFGAYREWYSNGILKLDTNIIGGTADINTAAEQSWLFDGCSQVWDEDGRLIANIPYVSGSLEGVSLYYHSNGTIWKSIPYHKNQIEGVSEVFLDNGQLLQNTTYVNGIKEGAAQRFWDNELLAAHELYCNGLLMTAEYFDRNKVSIAAITNGEGFRALFGKNNVSELQQYNNGVLDGEVRVFSEPPCEEQSILLRVYHMHNNVKHGEEIEYYSPVEVKGRSQPHLSINWAEGHIQGLVKTWYPNGGQESQREMSNNSKNGILTAWYQNGNVMLIEEYDHDKLVKGEYFSPGEKIPVSEVIMGRGTATLYDAQGNLLRRISYQNGKPTLE